MMHFCSYCARLRWWWNLRAVTINKFERSHICKDGVECDRYRNNSWHLWAR